jgi:HNH endonuclease
MAEGPLYWRVAARARFRCEYCLAPQIEFNLRFELEHIVPRSLGGLTFFGNLALACRSCNAAKADRVSAVDPTTHERVWIFNPRVSRWDDHFAIDPRTGRILGKTAIGRATRAQLKLDSIEQQIARQVWILKGLIRAP